MEFKDIVEKRRSIKSYEVDVSISDAELISLFETVALSPSSFNLQHWNFIAVRDAETKRKMRAAAFGQPQVEESSVTILVSGKLNGFEDAPRIYEEVPEEMRAGALDMIQGFYTGNEQAQRDEAIRSASLASMSLMYAAEDAGFSTGPMIGFDAAKTAELLNLPDNYVPVMLIVLGRGKGVSYPRAYRRPLDEIVKLDRFDGAGLQG
ncbi:nitroreductase family protein [bacterium AH-315-P07]|nr:nitroreductase family protein [bacterium AH-315-P07]